VQELQRDRPSNSTINRLPLACGWKVGIMKSFIATISDNLPIVLVSLLVLALLVFAAAIGINCHN
jgi:hypothetical protein